MDFAVGLKILGLTYGLALGLKKILGLTYGFIGHQGVKFKKEFHFRNP